MRLQSRKDRRRDIERRRRVNDAIGNHQVEEVRDLVHLLEDALGRKAFIRSAPRPATDVEATFASVDAIGALTGAAAGTAGAALTGNSRDIELPAESVLTFKLDQDLTLKPDA